MLRPYGPIVLSQGRSMLRPYGTATNNPTAYGFAGSSTTLSLSPVSWTIRRYHASG